MGLLRLFLAACVVLDHSLATRYRLVSGRTAVECFFVISGFYMALVLETKYGRLSGGRLWRTFMASRLGRLYPGYLAVVVATVLLAGYMHHRHEPVPLLDATLQAPALALVAVANATMVGLDVVTFGALSPDGGFFFYGRSIDVAHPAHPLILVPQAWSLSLELAFYTLAPCLLLRRTGILLAATLMSVAVRGVLAWGGFDDDPWSYRFFPSELSLFLAGALAFRGGRGRDFSRRVAWPSAALLVAGLLALPLTDSVELVALLAPYLIAPAIPILLSLSRRNGRDRWVGELSYPLYLVHVLVIAVAGEFGVRARPQVVLPLSLAAAVLLAVVVDRPVETFRQRRLAVVLGAPTQAVPALEEPALP